MLKPGIYYVQQRGDGKFLCDSEWDGDSFTIDPHAAIKRSEPWLDGGRLGGKAYTCVKVRLWFDVFATHDTPVMKSFQSRKGGKLRTRFRAECPRCRWSTNSYAEQMTAVSTWNHQKRNVPCQIERWELC